MDRDVLNLKMKEAVEVAHKAYAPYSGFRVGCVLETQAGNFFEGCNVENISYGLTCCAERNAVFKAISCEGPSMKIKNVFVSMADNKEGSPCGACRQVLAEFDDNSTVYFRSKGETKSYFIRELLPYGFDQL